jgi:GR25 family glycosyltransferase involved in LPS biosynthesis
MNLQFIAENVFVISLTTRNDRREKVSKELKSQKIPFQFYDAISDENPIYGCTASHINVIKIAREKKLPYVLIFEDDAKFVQPFKLPPLPKDWSMLFLGACVNKIYDEYYYRWKRCSNWYGHAYIVRDTLYDRIIEEASQNMDKRLIDEYYCEYLHPTIQSYCIYPTMVTQANDYSDILKTTLDRHQKIINFDRLVEMKNPNPPQFPEIYCINLKNRVDRHEYMSELFRKNNLRVNFYQADPHPDGGAVGCRTSHLAILKEARDRGLPRILIFEDDIEFVGDIREVVLPAEWSMFYLGGNWVDILNKAESDNYCRIRSWSTYAYAVSSSFYDVLIEGLSNTEKEIDRYYLENVHLNHPVYMSKPQIVVPNESFDTDSDIRGGEGDIVNYAFLRDLEKINLGERDVAKPAKLKIFGGADIKVIDDCDLPMVSIITPTRNRNHFMKLAVYNFYSQNYPKDKLEWIIIDESREPVKGLLPVDDRIKYYYVNDEERKYIFESWMAKYEGGSEEIPLPHKKEYGDFYKLRLPIGLKRNMGVKMATGSVIVHMDDDDYYPPNSVRLRINFMNYSKKPCVSCSSIASFNICRMISMINVPPFDMSYEKRTSEATMAYEREFWEKQRFEGGNVCSEGETFLKGRTDEVLDIDWQGIIISLRHSGNISNRNELTEEPNGWHFGKIDNQLFLFLTSLDEKKIDI